METMLLKRKRLLIGGLLVCLAVSGSGSCYKSYVRAHVPRCDLMNEEMGEEMLSTEPCKCGDATITYTADKTIPYCKGIDDLLDD